MTASLALTLSRSCWDINSIVQNLGLAPAIDGDLRHVREANFEHDGAIDDIIAGDNVLRSYADNDSIVAVAQHDAAIVVISQRSSKWVNVVVAAADAADAVRVLEVVRARRTEPGDPAHIIPIDFSYECDGSAKRVRRRLIVPAWEDISRNYSAGVRTDIDALMTMSPPTDDDGRLLLWHGPPGTGKTTAIRALMRSWRSWCKPMFIVDPDKLFATASYLLGAIVNDHGLRDSDWRLLVIEDADELLRADAKARSGQALSRLLNLSDGLIGQGLRVLVMLTTNEPLGELHPAVVRPGRCLSEICFGPLDRSEATDWLGRTPPGAQDTYTLAELYQHVT